MIPFPSKEYAEAVRRENYVREVAPHGLNENLCGFEVRPMKFIDFLALRLVRSPFLVGGDPDPKSVRAFLWRMSPEYSPDDLSARRKFMKRCRAFLPPDPPLIPIPWLMRRWAKRKLAALDLFGRLLKEIRVYASDMLQDWGSSKQQGNGVPYISNEVEIVGMIAREYKWSRKDILNLEMPVLLQHVKEIRMANGQKATFNPSDRFTFEWLKKRNMEQN